MASQHWLLGSFLGLKGGEKSCEKFVVEKQVSLLRFFLFGSNHHFIVQVPFEAVILGNRDCRDCLHNNNQINPKVQDVKTF